MVSSLSLFTRPMGNFRVLLFLHSHRCGRCTIIAAVVGTSRPAATPALLHNLITDLLIFLPWLPSHSAVGQGRGPPCSCMVCPLPRPPQDLSTRCCLSLLQPCLPPCCSSNMPGTPLPEGLCTCYSLCLEYSSSRIHLTLSSPLGLCSNVTISGRPSCHPLSCPGSPSLPLRTPYSPFPRHFSP